MISEQTSTDTIDYPSLADDGCAELGQSHCEHRNVVSVWGVPFDKLTLPQAIDRIAYLISRGIPELVITANLNYVMLHQKTKDLRRVTRDAAMILADGQPIVWRSKMGNHRLPERVAGSEMIFRLAERANAEGWRVYMLGGKPDVADRASLHLRAKYPGLKIVGVESPPFRQLTEREQDDQIKRINDSNADLLLVAFGQPKGEIWIHEHLSRLDVPVSIQLGATFDFLAGTANRAPLFWQRIGMEWAHRMACDPTRLLPRYSANASFLLRAVMRDVYRFLIPSG